MKSIGLIILTLILWQKTYSQIDTINYKAVEIIENKTPKSYKTTSFDSSAINNSENLSQLLSKNSTVFIKTYGSGSLATVSFRGTGASHTKVQWNGVSLNSPMNGQIDFSLYPTFFFDNAALHHGASGLIDGNGALGGSVIMNNIEIYNKGFSTSLKQSIGSYNSYTTAGKIIYSNNKWFSETKLYNNVSDNDFDFINVAKIDRPLEIQANSELKQYGIQQAIYRKFKNSSLGGRIWYFNSNRNLPHTMFINENDENQTDESIRALVEWKGLRNNFQYKVSIALVKDELIYDNKIANIYAKNNSYLIDNNIVTKYYLKKKIALSNKINIKYESATANAFLKKQTRFNNSWLIDVTKNLKKLTIDFFNRLIIIDNDIKPIAPSLGIRYQLLKKEQLYIKANAGLNYNYPTFNDLFWNPGGNENLIPEKAQMTEVGLSYSKSTKRIVLNTEFTTFYSIVDDWIIWQPTEFGFWSPSNLKKVKNRGIEGLLSISIKINKLSIYSKANYAYTESTNLNAKNDFDSSKNKQLIYVPVHKLNYSLRANYKSFTLIYSYHYTGKRFISTDNNWYLPANFLSNVTVVKKFKISDKSSLSTSFKINNLFNQDYQSIAWRPMAKRNYLFSLTLHIN